MAKIAMQSPSTRFFYPWPVVLVSSVDADGKPNVMVVAASSICSSNPPTIGVALGTMQYTLSLIQETGDFGANLPSREMLWQTDFCGSHSGRDMNKFEAAGLTVQPSRHIKSPLVAECPVSMECRVVHTVHLGNHDWLIGEIVAVYCDESVLDEEGHFDTSRIHPIFAYWNEYWSVGEKLRDWFFSRAEPRPE